MPFCRYVDTPGLTVTLTPYLTNSRLKTLKANKSGIVVVADELVFDLGPDMFPRLAKLAVAALEKAIEKGDGGGGGRKSAGRYSRLAKPSTIARRGPGRLWNLTGTLRRGFKPTFLGKDGFIITNSRLSPTVGRWMVLRIPAARSRNVLSAMRRELKKQLLPRIVRKRKRARRPPQPPSGGRAP